VSKLTPPPAGECDKIYPMSVDLSSLNPEQKEAVAYRGGPLLVLAGAGTGKTRVIVYRIASLIADGAPPGRILAVTFTNKAAAEMRNRIDGLVPGQGARVWVHTFHAFAARLLRRHAVEMKLNPSFTIYDQDDQKRLVVQSLKELGLEGEKNKASLFVSVISRAKDDLLDAKSYAIHAMAQRDPFRDTVARVYERYQAKLDAAGALDFGDLLLKAAETLRDNERLRSYYQKFFEHLLVDEYQDTNHAQYMVTKTLAAQHRNLCVVGDPDQSIYHFRGADIRNILEFEEDFKDTKAVKLEQNYRSTPDILDAAGAVIRNNRQRQDKKLWTQKPSGLPVEVRELNDEREEARWITGRIVNLLGEGASPKDVAVFYRTNAQSRQFEDAMRLASLPHRVVGSVRFYERKEVKDVIAYARAAINPSDAVSLARILNEPPRGIGKAAEECLHAHARLNSTGLREALAGAESVVGLSAAARRGAADLDRMLTSLSEDVRNLAPAEAMQAVYRKSRYWDWLEADVDVDPEVAGRLGNLQELLNAVQEFQERFKEEEETYPGEGTEEPASGGEPTAALDRGPGAPARLARFLEDASLQSGADTYDEAQKCVTLMTVHLAKGLEFPTVFVTGLEEGLFPISAGSSSDDDLEEERRLCYVAMTRAKERLVLTYAASRRLFGKSYTNIPSRFVLEASLPGLRKLQAEGLARAQLREAAGGAPGGAAPPADEPPPPQLLRIKMGMRVRHPEFGPGRIVEKSGAGESMKVTIEFDSGHTRKLLVRYAPLIPA